MQFQGTGANGGIVVAFTDGTNTSWSAKDQSGYYANDDQSQLTTHSRTIDLSSFAGKTINNIALNSESDAAAGAWHLDTGHRYGALLSRTYQMASSHIHEISGSTSYRGHTDLLSGHSLFLFHIIVDVGIGHIPGMNPDFGCKQ